MLVSELQDCDSDEIIPSSVTTQSSFFKCYDEKSHAKHEETKERISIIDASTNQKTVCSTIEKSSLAREGQCLELNQHNKSVRSDGGSSSGRVIKSGSDVKIPSIYPETSSTSSKETTPNTNAIVTALPEAMDGEEKSQQDEEAINDNNNVFGTSAACGTNEGGASVICGTNEDGASVICGTNEGGASVICGTNEDGESVICGTNEGGESVICGTNEGVESAICGTNEGGESVICSTNKGVASAICDTNEDGASVICGTNEDGASAICGTNEGGESANCSTNGKNNVICATSDGRNNGSSGNYENGIFCGTYDNVGYDMCGTYDNVGYDMCGTNDDQNTSVLATIGSSGDFAHLDSSNGKLDIISSKEADSLKRENLKKLPETKHPLEFKPVAESFKPSLPSVTQKEIDVKDLSSVEEQIKNTSHLKDNIEEKKEFHEETMDVGVEKCAELLNIESVHESICENIPSTKGNSKLSRSKLSLGKNTNKRKSFESEWDFISSASGLVSSNPSKDETFIVSHDTEQEVGLEAAADEVMLNLANCDGEIDGEKVNPQTFQVPSQYGAVDHEEVSPPNRKRKVSEVNSSKTVPKSCKKAKYLPEIPSPSTPGSKLNPQIQETCDFHADKEFDCTVDDVKESIYSCYEDRSNHSKSNDEICHLDPKVPQMTDNTIHGYRKNDSTTKEPNVELAPCAVSSEENEKGAISGHEDAQDKVIVLNDTQCSLVEVEDVPQERVNLLKNELAKDPEDTSFVNISFALSVPAVHASANEAIEQNSNGEEIVDSMIFEEKIEEPMEECPVENSDVVPSGNSRFVLKSLESSHALTELNNACTYEPYSAVIKPTELMTIYEDNISMQFLHSTAKDDFKILTVSHNNSFEMSTISTSKVESSVKKRGRRRSSTKSNDLPEHYFRGQAKDKKDNIPVTNVITPRKGACKKQLFQTSPGMLVGTPPTVSPVDSKHANSKLAVSGIASFESSVANENDQYVKTRNVKREVNVEKSKKVNVMNEEPNIRTVQTRSSNKGKKKIFKSKASVDDSSKEPEVSSSARKKSKGSRNHCVSKHSNLFSLSENSSDDGTSSAAPVKQSIGIYSDPPSSDQSWFAVATRNKPTGKTKRSYTGKSYLKMKREDASTKVNKNRKNNISRTSSIESLQSWKKNKAQSKKRQKRYESTEVLRKSQDVEETKDSKSRSVSWADRTVRESTNSEVLRDCTQSSYDNRSLYLDEMMIMSDKPDSPPISNQKSGLEKRGSKESSLLSPRGSSRSTRRSSLLQQKKLKKDHEKLNAELLQSKLLQVAESKKKERKRRSRRNSSEFYESPPMKDLLPPTAPPPSAQSTPYDTNSKSRYLQNLKLLTTDISNISPKISPLNNLSEVCDEKQLAPHRILFINEGQGTSFNEPKEKASNGSSDHHLTFPDYVQNPHLRMDNLTNSTKDDFSNLKSCEEFKEITLNDGSDLPNEAMEASSVQLSLAEDVEVVTEYDLLLQKNLTLGDNSSTEDIQNKLLVSLVKKPEEKKVAKSVADDFFHGSSQKTWSMQCGQPYPKGTQMSSGTPRKGEQVNY